MNKRKVAAVSLVRIKLTEFLEVLDTDPTPVLITVNGKVVGKLIPPDESDKKYMERYSRLT